MKIKKSNTIKMFSAFGVLVVAGIIFSLVYFDVADARESSLGAIDEASRNIDHALRAYAAGSPEEAELQSSLAALEEARRMHEEGSLVSKGKYAEAQEKAEESDDYAQTLLDNLATEYFAATNALNNGDFEKAFGFYDKYPRTEEAQRLLGSSENIFNDRIDSYTTEWQEDYVLYVLEETYRFSIVYPGIEIPGSITERTGEALIDFAYVYVYEAELATIANEHGFDSMRNYEEGFIWYEPEEFKNLVNKANAYMSELHMPPEMQQLLAKMGEMEQAKAGIIDLMGGPDNPDSYYVEYYQIDRASEYNDRLKELIEETKKLIEDVRAGYYEVDEQRVNDIIAEEKGKMKSEGAVLD